jgi:hypothetical protein
MSGLFDKLNQRLNIQRIEGGISPLDLAELPSDLRKLMRILMREETMTFQDLLSEIAGIKEFDQVNQEYVANALNSLSRQGWLIRRGEGEKLSYQVNMRRRSGSKLAAGIWSALDDRINQVKNASPKPIEDSGNKDDKQNG